MSRRLLSRAVVALALPALLVVPSLGSPAVAAKGSSVPSVAKVAKIYPYLAGGTMSEATSKIRPLNKKCEPGKPIKGAKGTSASYSPADASTAGTAANPYVGITAVKFRNAKAATTFLRSSSKSTKCVGTGGEDVKASVKKFAVKLGDQSVGYTVTLTISGQKFISQSVLVREGKHIVTAGVSSMDGAAPDKKKAIAVTKLAVKTAR